ncbi:uncharacterized protein LOC106051762 [Biomphalaria glabrata]|uniref:Uncharacterized protein LOC106051762 n=1 Tax=Biomphalaria glabrata TaxID=6526 RepID=A0A9U8DW42_BIOGL|nr:uncharacterized protein LOC106051762 [Biomphalaria glabrata]XP_013062421.2 uncharacterized protein LOC106051762 [Biomphalaria glabrata]
MVERLISSGDLLATAERIAFGKEDEPQDDMVCGWGRSFSFPRQVLSATSRSQGCKRKASKLLPSSIDPSNLTVRLVSEDFIVDHLRSAWKANVEPGTYRYISNNGHYRMTKFSAYGPEWSTMRRSRLTERSSVASFDVKQTQKILKKDLESNFKLQPVLESPPSSHNQSLPQSNGDGNLNSFSVSKTEKVSETLSSRTDFERSNHARSEVPEKRVDSAPSLGTRQHNISGNIHYHSLQNSISQRIPLDSFYINGMVRADTVLRPLEKLTPFQKHIDRRMSEPNKQAEVTPSTQAVSLVNSTGSSRKAPGHDAASAHLMGQAETDILSRLRNRFNVPPKDDGKPGMYSLLHNNVIKDYSRLLTEKANAPLLGAVNGTVKSLAAHRRAPMPSKANGSGHLQGSGIGELGKRAPLDTSANPTIDTDFALPEISGKRIAVAATLHHRLL